MKKLLTGLLVFVIGLICLSTPLSIINIYEKGKYLHEEGNLIKVKIKVDSVKVFTTQSARGNVTSDPYLFYNYYYNQGNFFTLNEGSNNKLSVNEETHLIEDIRLVMKKHNDSVWIWNHPDVRARYARPEETKLNTDGFVNQIIVNFILIFIAVFAIIWQIGQWRKPKTK